MSPRLRTWPAALLAVALVLAACDGGTQSPADDLDAPADDLDAPTDDRDTSDAGEDAPGAGPDDPDASADRPAPSADADGDAAPDAEPQPDAGPPREQRPDLSVALRLTDVATMDAPTAGAVGPDGRLFLAERAGTVHPLTADGIGRAVVDITAQTTTDGERGLLGLAFAPDGSELYLSSTDLDGDSVITAIALDADGTPLAEERRTVLRVEQPFANHNGGNVAFGPDGMLYVGLGDGGSGGDPLDNGQDLGTLLGAILRIDPLSDEPYVVPADNPFVGVPDAAEEIWAYGLRNPWRFSFDRATGDLTIADVGQSSREEINWVRAGGGAGANFGWNRMEGTLSFAGDEPQNHVPPVYEYQTRGPQGCAVTGGYVYRGEAIPALVGAYLYSDLCDAGLYAIVIEDGELVDEAELGVAGEQVVSFAEDAEGELYLLDFGGAVRRLEPA